MKNKIGIWAPLRYANYGDDLQAILFAYFLESIGYKTILFQLNENLANTYKLDTAHTVDELCSDSKICIIAGGALLTPFSIIQRFLSKSANEYERDFKDLYRAGKKYGTKFCAISMGGDGLTRNPYLHYSLARITFFKSKYFLNGTVRLEGDMFQMKKFKKNFTYIPDCLLQTNNFLNISKKREDFPTTPYRVALNFKKRHVSTKLLNEIFLYAKKNKDVEFFFVTTHLEDTEINYEYIPNEKIENIKIVHYKTPSQLLEFISGVDILITSKLHLGITGLTVGTPFISYRGPGKAKSFVKSIGGDWSIVDDNIGLNDLKKQFFFKSKESLFEKYNINTLGQMIKNSYKQYEFCEKIVKKFHKKINAPLSAMVNLK